MNIAQYCAQTIKYIVQTFIITTRQSIILCNNILQYYWPSMCELCVYSSRCAPWPLIGRAEVLFRSVWTWALMAANGKNRTPDVLLSPLALSLVTISTAQSRHPFLLVAKWNVWLREGLQQCSSTKTYHISSSCSLVEHELTD